MLLSRRSVFVVVAFFFKFEQLAYLILQVHDFLVFVSDSVFEFVNYSSTFLGLEFFLLYCMILVVYQCFVCFKFA